MLIVSSISVFSLFFNLGSSEYSQTATSQASSGRNPVAMFRADQSLMRSDVDNFRANSLTGSSTFHLSNKNPSPSNRVSAFTASSAATKSLLTSQKAPQSSQPRQHRASVPCTDQEKLARSLTSLNIATFDPMLPSTLGQRSSTFVGRKKQIAQLRAPQNQYTTVSH